MKVVTVYGRPSFTSEYFMNLIIQETKKAGLNIKMKLVSEIKEIAGMPICSTPAIEFEGEIKETQKGNIEKSAKEISSWLIQKEKQMLYRNIIVPIDFSDNSLNAYNYALSFSDHIKALITLVHVYKPDVSTFNKNSLSVPVGLSKSEESLEDYIAIVKRNYPEKEIESRFLIGFPGDEILKISAETLNNIVIMGKVGMNDGIKKFLGSVSTKVGLHAKTSVLIIPEKVNKCNYKKIAFCITSEKVDVNSVYTISNFAKAFNAELHLIHIQKNIPISVNQTEDFWKPFINKDKLHIHNISNDDVAKGIQTYCTEKEMDLLAINRKNRSLLSLLVQKSVTKQMIQKIEIPLLITHNN